MIPSFYPTETWVMRIFPYLVNYDTTTRNNQNHFPILLSMESYKQQFFRNAIVRIHKINKIKPSSFILKLADKTYPYNANTYENMLLSIPKQPIITLKQQLKILIFESCDRNPSSRSDSAYSSFKLPLLFRFYITSK